MEKKIGKYWFCWGRTSGFALGFNISKYNWGIELGFWYIGQEFSMANAVAKKTPTKAPAKKTAGRKTALLDEVKEQTLLDYIRIGTPVRKAVSASGIAEKTFYNWMSRGLAERERLSLVPNAKNNSTEVVFLQFLQRVEQARAEAIAKKIAVIAKSGNEGDWRAAAWWLERQVPEEFGKTDRFEIGGTNGEAIKVQVEMGDLEDKIAKVLAIRKR